MWCERGVRFQLFLSAHQSFSSSVTMVWTRQEKVERMFSVTSVQSEEPPWWLRCMAIIMTIKVGKNTP
jgi:hypothetical protein